MLRSVASAIILVAAYFCIVPFDWSKAGAQQANETVETDYGLKVTINSGDKTYAAILDTGASRTLMTEELADELALSPTGETFTLRTPYGELLLPKLEFVTLHHHDGNRQTRVYPVMVPRDFLATEGGRVLERGLGPSGLKIGIDALNQSSWVIDDRNGTVQLNGYWTAESKGGFPAVEVNLFGQVLHCIVDTGPPHSTHISLSLRHPLAARLVTSERLVQVLPSEFFPGRTQGIYFDPEGTVQGLEGQGVTVSIEAIPESATGGEFHECDMGRHYLRGNRLSFDVDAGVATFEGELPLARYNRSGLNDMISAGSPHGLAFEVLSLERDSPAYRAGLRAGDLIFQFNGKPLPEYSKLDLLNIFSQRVGTEVNVDYSRPESGEALSATIILADASQGNRGESTRQNRAN